MLRHLAVTCTARISCSARVSSQQRSLLMRCYHCCHATAADTTLLAIGDAAGIVSSWDIVQGCLVSAAQAHDGPVSSVSWMLTGAATGFLHSSWGRSATSSSVISCGYDGAVAELQPDHSIPMLYSAAFRGLYYSCKKNNKVTPMTRQLSERLSLLRPSVVTKQAFTPATVLYGAPAQSCKLQVATLRSVSCCHACPLTACLNDLVQVGCCVRR